MIIDNNKEYMAYYIDILIYFSRPRTFIHIELQSILQDTHMYKVRFCSGTTAAHTL